MLAQLNFSKGGWQITKFVFKDIWWVMQSFHSIYLSFYDLAFYFININEQLLTFGSNGLQTECLRN